jgi:hypothetical protein
LFTLAKIVLSWQFLKMKNIFFCSVKPTSLAQFFATV